MGEYQREFTHEELLARARLIGVAKQERDAELDRLRAKLANARLERDDIASLNSSLIAELAEALHSRYLQREAWEFELRNNSTKDARIAELEAERDRERLMRNLYEDAVKRWQPRAEHAEARIVELEATILHWTSEVARLEHNCDDDQDRAERAEARVAELTEANDHLNGPVAEMLARAERAEAELKAMRELLDWIYGFLAYVDSYHSRIIRDKTRAALAPSPKG